MSPLKEKLDAILKHVNLPAKKAKLSELEALTYDGAFWSDPVSSAATMKEINQIKKNH
jgi:hypothetical protein